MSVLVPSPKFHEKSLVCAYQLQLYSCIVHIRSYDIDKTKDTRTLYLSRSSVTLSGESSDSLAPANAEPERRECAARGGGGAGAATWRPPHHPTRPASGSGYAMRHRIIYRGLNTDVHAMCSVASDRHRSA